MSVSAFVHHSLTATTDSTLYVIAEVRFHCLQVLWSNVVVVETNRLRSAVVALRMLEESVFYGLVKCFFVDDILRVLQCLSIHGRSVNCIAKRILNNTHLNQCFAI